MSDDCLRLCRLLAPFTLRPLPYSPARRDAATPDNGRRRHAVGVPRRSSLRRDYLGQYLTIVLFFFFLSLHSKRTADSGNICLRLVWGSGEGDVKNQLRENRVQVTDRESAFQTEANRRLCNVYPKTKRQIKNSVGNFFSNFVRIRSVCRATGP